MVRSCSAYNCTNRYTKGGEIKFHKFPLKDTALMKKWVIATKRDRFVPSDASFICSEHFTRSDYLFSDSKKLKDSAVPSVFNFPAHLKQVNAKRKEPSTREQVLSSKKIKVLEINETGIPAFRSPPRSPQKDELKLKLIKQRSKIKTLQ